MRLTLVVGRWVVLDLELFQRVEDDPDDAGDEGTASVSLRGDIEQDFGFAYRNEVPMTTLTPLEDDDYED